MRNLTESNLTAAVIAKIKSDNPRTQQVVESLIHHLHAFVRDIEPTEAEWFTAIDFLTRTGQKCDAKRQEFILLSDTLGVSMLVDAINHRVAGELTESTVFGPFWVEGAPVLEAGTNIAKGNAWETGEPTVVRCNVVDPDGNPIANAIIDVWQASPEGFYDVQDPNMSEMNLRGVFKTDEKGKVWFRTVKPLYYPIPTDGPVGELLQATGRHPMRPAHIHFMFQAPGYERLITHLFVEGDPYLESDAVFGVKDSLVVDFIRNRSQDDALAVGFEAPFYEVEFTFGLKPVS